MSRRDPSKRDWDRSVVHFHIARGCEEHLLIVKEAARLGMSPQQVARHCIKHYFDEKQDRIDPQPSLCWISPHEGKRGPKS